MMQDICLNFLMEINRELDESFRRYATTGVDMFCFFAIDMLSLRDYLR